jgi:hypothetical protein
VPVVLVLVFQLLVLALVHPKDLARFLLVLILVVLGILHLPLLALGVREV